MMKKSLFLVMLVMAFSLQAEVCEGLHRCSLEFSLLENAEVEFEKKLNRDVISLSVNETILTKETSLAEFKKYLAFNLLEMNEYRPKKFVIKSLRDDKFMRAPFYVVTPGNIPPMFSKEGPVTLLYVSKKKLKDLRTWRINRLLKESKIIENEEYSFFTISDTYEKASDAMERLMKEDRN